MGAAAVGHHLLIGMQLGEMFLQLGERNVDRAGHVAGGEFLRRAHVQHGYQAVAGALEQLLAGDGFEIVLDGEVSVHQLVHLRHVGLRQAPQAAEQRHHVLAAEAVEDMQALLAGVHQAHLAELLEVARGIGHRQAGETRQFLHAAFPLGEKFQHFQTVTVTEGLAHAGELGEELLLEAGA